MIAPDRPFRRGRWPSHHSMRALATTVCLFLLLLGAATSSSARTPGSAIRIRYACAEKLGRSPALSMIRQRSQCSATGTTFVSFASDAAVRVCRSHASGALRLVDDATSCPGGTERGELPRPSLIHLCARAHDGRLRWVSRCRTNERHLSLRRFGATRRRTAAIDDVTSTSRGPVARCRRHSQRSPGSNGPGTSGDGSLRC